jgi:hypothetical protein
MYRIEVEELMHNEIDLDAFNATAHANKVIAHAKNVTAHHKNGTAHHKNGTAHAKNGTAHHKNGTAHHKNATAAIKSAGKNATASIHGNVPHPHNATEEERKHRKDDAKPVVIK